MDNITKKSQLMDSLKKKWGEDQGLKRKIGDIIGSVNKSAQIKHISSEFSGLSSFDVEKKMKLMGLSPEERKRFIKDNKEFSRVFGIKDDEDKVLSKREKRKLQKKEEMHKKFMVRRSKESIIEDKKSARRNRVANVYSDGHGSAKEYGYANVEEEGHHGVAALGGAKGSASVSSFQKDDSVIGGSSATGLTGANRGGISKTSRPLGL